MAAQIDDAFQEPQLLHPRVSAVGPHRALVRHDLGEIDAHVPDPVYTWKHLCPDNATQRLVTRVRAAVVYMARIDGGDHTLFIQSHAGVVEGPLVTMGAGLHMFGAGFGPLDGPAA